MMGHRFNPQLTRGRVQYSDWPSQLSIRIFKRVLNIACIQFPTSEFHNFVCSFNNDIIFQNSFAFLLLWSLEPNTGDIYLICQILMVSIDISFIYSVYRRLTVRDNMDRTVWIAGSLSTAMRERTMALLLVLMASIVPIDYWKSGLSKALALFLLHRPLSSLPTLRET